MDPDRPGLSAPERRALQERLAHAGVHSLLVQFTDLFAAAKGKLVPLHQLPAVLDTGAGFAGPSIRGTGLPREGPRSEFYARGDAATALPLPWMPGVARIVGDGFVAGMPFEGCPRGILARQLRRLAAAGLRVQLGIEPEFFLLRRDERGRWVPADPDDRLDKPSYDLKSLARRQPLLLELSAALEAAGFEVLQIDHEDAHGQYELNFLHDEPLASCDRLMLFKLAAQDISERHGCVFSLMPKPFEDQPGSGMHFHVSLWRGEAAVEPATLEHFIAGVLAHSAALTALAAPTVNSYRRLAVSPTLSGTSWAPAFVAHGPNNRTALVRTLPGRFEWRLPDAAANPYLACAGMVAAGLHGIEAGMPLPPDVQDDLFEWPLARIREAGIPLLPQGLDAALDALAADAVVRSALGDTAHGCFEAELRAEALAFARHVGDWERERYARAF